MEQIKIIPTEKIELKNVAFHVPTKPQGKARARSVVTPNGKIRHYTPENTREYENLIAMQAKLAMSGTPPFEMPIRLTLTIVMPISKGYSKKKMQACKEQTYLPTTKPDADNVEKAIKDACNGIVWIDDCYVVECYKRKMFETNSRKLGVYVQAEELPALPAQAK